MLTSQPLSLYCRRVAYPLFLTKGLSSHTLNEEFNTVFFSQTTKYLSKNSKYASGDKLLFLTSAIKSLLIESFLSSCGLCKNIAYSEDLTLSTSAYFPLTHFSSIHPYLATIPHALTKLTESTFLIYSRTFLSFLL